MCRGGIVNENDALEALENGTIFSSIDVFEVVNQYPRITSWYNIQIFMEHLTRGAATLEAQDRVGTDIAKAVMMVLEGRIALLQSINHISSNKTSCSQTGGVKYNLFFS